MGYTQDGKTYAFDNIASGQSCGRENVVPGQAPPSVTRTEDIAVGSLTPEIENLSSGVLPPVVETDDGV